MAKKKAHAFPPPLRRSLSYLSYDLSASAAAPTPPPTPAAASLGTQLLARVHSNPSFTSASAIDEDNGAVALDARDVAANILKALALDLLDHHLPLSDPVMPPSTPCKHSDASSGVRGPSLPQLPESPPRRPHQPHRRRALQPRQRQALRLLGKCYEHKGYPEAAEAIRIQRRRHNKQYQNYMRAIVQKKSLQWQELIHTGQFLEDDPFIFSSQAKQVFYVQDPGNEDWNHVITTKPRDLYDIRVEMQEEDDETYTQCLLPDVMGVDELNDCTNWNDAMVKVNANIASESSTSIAELENDAFIGIKGKYRYG
uniref:DUF4216 domain-containing protein n=1 Tax=Ananas comosus var. bracteatus TaxID=296719 RepID=A0A6V7NHJ6_ANACO|nr:unnamed protein product [Ananas comosus var. bracteatus]